LSEVRVSGRKEDNSYSRSLLGELKVTAGIHGKVGLCH